MKKLIQISLIAILVLVLFQAAAGGSVAVSNQAHMGTASRISSLVNTTPAGAQLAVCPLIIKGVGCIRPNVGWNS